MANYKIGDYIRLMRKSVGMSQEELAFQANVATETISRIENGRHKITPNVYKKIMSVFDYFPQQFYGICNYKEVEIMNEKQLAEDAEVKFEFEKAKEYIEILKQKVDDNIINRQYILRAETICNFYTQKISVEQMVEELETALNLTVNDYERILSSGENYPFTEQEASILMNIADAYGKLKEYERDEKMKRMLLKCLETGYMSGKSIPNLILSIKRNLGYTLMIQKRYEEAIEFLINTLDEAKKEGNGTIISIVLSDIAWSMRKINKMREDKMYGEERIKEVLRQAYYIAAARNDNHVRDVVKKALMIDYNEDIEVGDM